MNTDAFDMNSKPSLFDFFSRLFVPDFMPHGHCFFWRPDILWLHVISDAVIAVAYYSIPLTLLYFISKRKDIPFNGIFIMFSIFIFLCGTTHVLGAYTMWVPAYRLEGIVKVLTAIVSIFTAGILIPIMPKAIEMPAMPALISQLSTKSEELAKINSELDKFNKLALGREKRIIELKTEVNKLSQELGRKPPFDMIR